MIDNERKIYKLVDALRFRMGAYNLFSNIVYLLFLKFIVAYSDRLELSSLEAYKTLSTFKRKYDLARVGNEYLRPEDIYDVLSALDSDPKLGALHLTDAAKNYHEIFSDERVQREVLNLLDEFDLDGEALGDFYEFLLQRCVGDVRRTGEFVTSKSLRLLAKELLEVKSNETYMDCYSGFSSTLLDIGDYGNYLGYEINPETALVSKMNLMIHQKSNYDIIVENFLEADTHEVADKIFSDGPINLVVDRPDLCVKFDVQTRDLDVLSIFKIADSLKEGGKAVITVPGKVLFSTARGYIQLRKYLSENGLKAVIGLPNLWSGTAIPTNVLVIEKGYKGNVEFIDAKSCGVSDRRNTTLPAEAIARISDCIKNQKDVLGFAKSVDYRDVICQGTWVPTNYVEVETKNEYRDINEIDDELGKLYAELKNNL